MEALLESPLVKEEPRPIKRPAAKLKASDYGGRVPKVGDRVLYWQVSPDGTYVASPADLIALDGSKPGYWALNSQRFGQLIGRRNVPWSDKPKQGVWTWQESPKE